MTDRPLRIAGEDVVTGEWIEVRSPHSEELLGRVARAGPAEIERAIASAAEGFAESRRLPAYAIEEMTEPKTLFVRA